jgi:hypothetical protein
MMTLPIINSAVSAEPYTGKTSINGAIVKYSISTDDARGILSASNIKSYKVSVAGLNGGFSFSSANGVGAGVSGNSLIASSNILKFNFDPSSMPFPSLFVLRGGENQALGFSSGFTHGPITQPGNVQIVDGTDFNNFRTMDQTGIQFIALRFYQGELLINGATVNYSIFTNGALGVLSATDITSYKVSVTGLNGGFSFSSANGDGAGVLGNALVASASSLTFNYDPSLPGTSFVLRGGENQFLGFSAGLTNGPITQLGRVQIVDGTDFNNFRTMDQMGIQTLEYFPSNVPEPAVWIAMTLGFGLVGFTMRHRRQAVGEAF